MKDFCANLIDMIQDPLLKAEAYESVRARDKDEIERLLKEDADKN